MSFVDQREPARDARSMVAAIAAYRREKDLASRASAPASGQDADPWKTQGRRAALRGELR